MMEDVTAQKKPFWGPWSTAGFGCGLLVVFSIIGGLIAIGFLVFKFIDDPTASVAGLAQGLVGNGLVLSLSTFASAIVCVGLIVLIINMRHTLSVKEYLGLRPISRKTILVSLAVATGIILLCDGLSYLLGEQIVTEWQLNLYMTSGWPVLLWVALIIFAPAFEETLFRGFLFEGFKQSRIGVIGAIVLTALTWTLLHMQYDAYHLAQVFVMGIVLGIMRFRTASLRSPLLMHAFMNLVAMIETSFCMMFN